MASSGGAKGDLANFLNKLESKSEAGYGRLSFQARAVGKSKDALHLAVETGIIAVPLGEIESIRPIPGRSDLEILIDVRNGDQIRQLRQVPDIVHRPVPPGTLPDIGVLPWPPRVPPGGFPHTGADGGASSSTGDCSGIDTTCASGGVADQTDDYRQSCWHDTD